MNINIEEDSMSSLDAYMNPSSLLQTSLFKYKPCTLWPRNHRCPVVFDGEKKTMDGQWEKSSPMSGRTVGHLVFACCKASSLDNALMSSGFGTRFASDCAHLACPSI